MSSVLEARTITKEFPGVRALDGVSFDVRAGEIHALCGENGAGKSTLMKILAGVYPSGSFGGEVSISGIPQSFYSTQESRRAGISVVYQELSLIPEMTIAENIFLGSEPNRSGVLKKHELTRRAREVLSSIGLDLDPQMKVAGLGIGEKQMVEIAKALAQNPRFLILDEPTSALTEREVESCLKLLVSLKNRGLGLILITHKLKEVFKVSDRITVFRDGHLVRTIGAKQCDEDQLIAMMVGRQIQNLYPTMARKVGGEVLRVSELTVPHPRIPHRNLVDRVSFHVRAGEILGLAGLMGSGRTETLMAIFGALPYKVTGEIQIQGRAVKVSSPRLAYEYGLSLASEDRKRFGLVLEDPIFKNISLPSLERFSRGGILKKNDELRETESLSKRFRVKAPTVTTLAKNLSGGNQQKVVLAKCVLKGPKVLFLDEPTRGIDVGARSEIYDWIASLASQGLAIVVVSSEMQEVIGLSDRVLVMCEGRITEELTRDVVTEERIMSAATRFQQESLLA